MLDYSRLFSVSWALALYNTHPSLLVELADHPCLPHSFPPYVCQLVFIHTVFVTICVCRLSFTLPNLFSPLSRPLLLSRHALICFPSIHVDRWNYIALIYYFSFGLYMPDPYVCTVLVVLGMASKAI